MNRRIVDTTERPILYPVVNSISHVSANLSSLRQIHVLYFEVVFNSQSDI